MSFEPDVTAEAISSGIAPFLADATLAFVWVDADLRVTKIIGAGLPGDFVGAELGLCFPVFVGYEDDFAELRAGSRAALDLANVSMPGIEGLGERIHLSVRWSAPDTEFVILLARALGRADLDLELQRQFRARRLAETELVEQAASVHATNQVLAEVNRDLAEFTHVVSHDLKAPMRAMRYFVDDLEASLTDADIGTSDARSHLARLRAQSRRMTAMLSSLLSYAKLDQKYEALEEVPTGGMLDAIIRSLPPRAGVRVQVTGDWPVLETVPTLLDVVLRNLIDNALRYARPADDAVAINGRLDGDAFVITVCDNGPGIPEHAREAIFNPFTSIESEREQEENGFQQTGMGLALVRRAAERAGARIVATERADKGSGACFKLDWPLNTDVG